MNLFRDQVAKKLFRTIKPLHLGYKIFIFQLEDAGQTVIVSLTHKGWMCDYVEPFERWKARCKRNDNANIPRWSCSYNNGVACRHIKACSNFINRMKLIQTNGKDVELDF